MKHPIISAISSLSRGRTLLYGIYADVCHSDDSQYRRQMDGVFVDQGKWCSPFVCKDRPGVYAPGVLEAWTAG